MIPSPVHPSALHIDAYMPERHFSKVFHRDRGIHHEIATFTDPQTHRADAEAFIAMSLARDHWQPANPFAPQGAQVAIHGYETGGTGATLGEKKP